jgi:hypothetical protein
VSYHALKLRTAAGTYNDSPILSGILYDAAAHIEWLEALLDDANKRAGVTDLEAQLRASVALLGEKGQ